MEINKAKICSCQGCHQDRNELSIYCTGHRNHYAMYGHPTLSPPKNKELLAIEQGIKDWLEQDCLISPVDKDGFKKLWGSAVIRLNKSPRYAISFGSLEGVSGFTAKTKGAILMSWYQHRQGRPFGVAMLRYMAVRLWAECRYTLAPGKKDHRKELNSYVNLHAGKFVVAHSGFEKIKAEEHIVGWERSIFAPNFGEDRKYYPIKEKTQKTIKLSRQKSAPIAKAIGKELREAVEYALGPRWYTQSQLQDRIMVVLSNPNS